MLFNSMEFLIFFPIVTIIYYLLPHKVRYIWLLITSYYFYMNWNAVYGTLLFFSTFITYIGGRIIERLKKEPTEATKRKQKICLIAALVINLGVLGYYKYFEFAVDSINGLLSFLHMPTLAVDFSILLPVGISFYTLQALGYLLDVYRGEIYAEKNFLRYALFVSYFPQLVAGPIERSKNLLVQLHKKQTFTWDNFRKGMFLILWGLFMKMVLADRIATIVDTVYQNCTTYQGFYIIVATALFAIQIYCDFCGYSTIAQGCGLIMGIHLMDNFKAPFFAKSIKEFWNRWHISLSGWFLDYLYIPLGGNRKGWWKKQRNLMIVFAVSGLWHGASFAYMIWGVLNGAYQIIGNIRDRIKERLGWNQNREETLSCVLWQRVATFSLFAFSLLFFRAGSMAGVKEVFGNLFCFNWTVLFDGSLYQLGVGKEMFGVMMLAIVALFCYDYKRYCGVDMAAVLLQQKWWFRALVYVGILFVILLFGCYGVEYDTQQFIYFQF